LTSATTRSVQIVLTAALLAALVACGPSYKRRFIETGSKVEIILRGQKGDGGLVDQGFAHPLDVSGVRVTHILAQLDVRDEAAEGGERRPAIPTNSLYDIGRAVSLGLAKATPAEEVVVRSFRKAKRLGIFSKTYLTSLVIYAQEDLLFVHVRHVDWPIPKPDEPEPPEPWVYRTNQSFKILPGDAMTAVGPQEVAVDWRDPVFRKASSIRMGPGGRIERRVILMEMEDEPTAAELEQEEERAGRLSPQTLRELADLEEKRLSGEVSESQYKAKRRAILAGEPTSP
jgi:hypothetical protein